MALFPNCRKGERHASSRRATARVASARSCDCVSALYLPGALLTCARMKEDSHAAELMVHEARHIRAAIAAKKHVEESVDKDAAMAAVVATHAVAV